MGLFGGLLGGLFGGGGGGGISSGGIASGNDKSTHTDTTNNTSYSDSRTVNDAAGGVAGSGNQWDASTRYLDSGDKSLHDSGNTNTYWDASNRSTTNWDGSNRSTTNWDGSNRSTNTDNSTRTNTDSGNTNWTWDNSTNTTDGGAFGLVTDVSLAQTAAARAIAEKGLSTGENMTGRAVQLASDANLQAARSARESLDAALGFARTSQTAAFDSSTKALVWAGETFGQLAKLSGDLVQSANKQTSQAASTAQAAYQQAADSSSGNRTLMIAGAGLLVVVFLTMRKH